MDKQDKLIARLFKDTLIIFLLSMFVSTIGYVIDGVITGKFLGTEAITAFGLTMPYQRFVTIFPSVIMLGMQVMCSKSLGRGDLREANSIFSIINGGGVGYRGLSDGWNDFIQRASSGHSRRGRKLRSDSRSDD